ncbi:MAG: aldehyde dehydrogenase family protein, partial [Deferrisomatales bacterium]
AREAFGRAVAAVGRELPLAAGSGGRRLDHPCPDDAGRVATRVALASAADAARAVETAARSYPAWRDRPLRERAELLDKLGDRLAADRGRLAAVMVWEQGKPWREADADLAEAVDFCRYYARQALRELGEQTLGDAPGEVNRLWYEGRGPAAVIAPWNFPLAIPTGMVAAALVAGNPVILKPAEQASGVAAALHRHLLAAGFPPDVAQLLPGLGEEAGRALAEDPRVALVAFTGSKAVGLALLEAAGRTRPGQPEVKKVVCEMGGKNAVIVDESAELDAAVAGVVKSAFGYAGQKCSACSRVLVVGAAWEPFAARLVEAVRSLPLGPAHEPGCGLGPVVDREAFERLQAVIADPGPGARALFVGEPREGGWFVPPALYEVTDPGHRLLRDELFGPVLALRRAETFEAALAEAVAVEYALTGAVYSRTPSHLELAARRFRVGNLYLNRPCTGAIVGRQPFGGFAMSGAGTKAGGPGYLTHFAVPRCVTESTARRGFTPEVQV